jgi:hypothetical protein
MRWKWNKRQDTALLAKDCKITKERSGGTSKAGGRRIKTLFFFQRKTVENAASFDVPAQREGGWLCGYR